MNQKILFVDDEENVLKSLKRDMSMADIDAEYLTSAAEALDYLGQHQIDIVVTDLKMPGMNGVAFLKQVQNSYPDIYRVMLSDFSSENTESKQAFQDRTIEQWFSKSLDVDELLTYFGKFK
ncbi:MAG: response regulator [Thermodesulfobacteriota bacterium]|nr:response regulator [Thermodesulfobacteriota bacterium]